MALFKAVYKMSCSSHVVAIYYYIQYVYISYMHLQTHCCSHLRIVCRLGINVSSPALQEMCSYLWIVKDSLGLVTPQGLLGRPGLSHVLCSRRRQVRRSKVNHKMPSWWMMFTYENLKHLKSLVKNFLHFLSFRINLQHTHSLDAVCSPVPPPGGVWLCVNTVCLVLAECPLLHGWCGSVYSSVVWWLLFFSFWLSSSCGVFLTRHFKYLMYFWLIHLTFTAFSISERKFVSALPHRAN